jgi:hypothetical protein
MKIFTSCLTGSCLLLAVLATQAQPDTAKMTRNILSFADSLVKTDSFRNWSDYADLAQASVIKYYGGKQGFIEHIRTGRLRTVSAIAENAAELSLVQLQNVKDDEWQCVVRESRYFHQNDQKFHFITSLIGQSKDGGETWRLFDVSYNSVANIIYLFPEIFGDLEIKEAVILTPEQELAQQQAATQAAAGKKATTRKK